MLARYLRSQDRRPVRYAISTAPEDTVALQNYLAFLTRAFGVHPGAHGLPGVAPEAYGSLPPAIQASHASLVTRHHPSRLISLIHQLAQHHAGQQPGNTPWVDSADRERLGFNTQQGAADPFRALTRMHDLLEQNAGAAYHGFSPEMLRQQNFGNLFTRGTLHAGLGIPGGSDVTQELHRNLGRTAPGHPLLTLIEHLQHHLMHNNDPMALVHLHDVAQDIRHNPEHPWHNIDVNSPRRQWANEPKHPAGNLAHRIGSLFSFGVIPQQLRAGENEVKRLLE